MNSFSTDELIILAKNLENAAQEFNARKINLNKDSIVINITTDQQTILKLDRELYNMTRSVEEHKVPDTVVVDVMGFHFVVKTKD